MLKGWDLRQAGSAPIFVNRQAGAFDSNHMPAPVISTTLELAGS